MTTVGLRDGNIVSVASNHFGDYHRRDLYYGIALKKLIQGNEKACIKWHDEDVVSIGEVQWLQLENLAIKINTLLPDMKKKKFTFCIAAPLNTASNNEGTKSQIDLSTRGKVILLFQVTQDISNYIPHLS